MSKSALIFFTIVTYVVGFLTGFALQEPKPKPEVSYSELEKDLDRARCDAEKIELLLMERIRLTGKPNP